MAKPSLASGYESMSRYFSQERYHPCVFDIRCGEEDKFLFDPRATTVEILGVPALFNEDLLNSTLHKSLSHINIANAALIVCKYSGKQSPEIGKQLTYEPPFIVSICESGAGHSSDVITSIDETYIAGSGGRKMKKLYKLIVDEVAREEFKKRIT